MKFIKIIILIFCFAFKLLAQTTPANADAERIKNFPKTFENPTEIPTKKNVWVFIMSGQSNMAGRGQVEPMDTIINKRILTINKNGDIIYAKEPLHFYEPNRAGLDCGISFANTLLQHIPTNISILIIPTAIGGSSIQQWLYDSLYRNVNVLSNFNEKVKLALHFGTIKAILWHQGESNTDNETQVNLHPKRMDSLFNIFRKQLAIKSCLL